MDGSLPSMDHTPDPLMPIMRTLSRQTVRADTTMFCRFSYSRGPHIGGVGGERRTNAPPPEDTRASPQDDSYLKSEF